MMINANNLADLNVSFNAAFQRGAARAQPTWDRIATPVPSTTSEEHYAWLGQFPRLREWIGDRQIKAMATHDYRIKNKSFEATIEVDRDPILDDKYGLYTPLFEEMGYAGAMHPDELVFSLLPLAFTSTCYDGQYFFDTDHPVGIPGRDAVSSVSNYQGGSSAPWMLLDTSRPLKPFIWQKRQDYNLVVANRPDDTAVFKSKKFLYGVDGRGNAGFGFWQLGYGSKQTLNQANYESARAAMKAFQSDEGRPLLVMPKILLCGPSNEAAARQVIKVQKLASGADNPNYNEVEIMVTPYLQ
jgi:phage major head subunit gpT-like protein